MPLVIKDYYNSNDYNGLFSWLLSNLRHGEFEELNNNLLKKELLRRFITHYFTTSNDMVLLVSIPDTILEKDKAPDVNNKHYFLQQINEQKSIDFQLLENFLKDYFHLDSLNNICIKKLVTYIEDKKSAYNRFNDNSNPKKGLGNKKNLKINVTNNCLVYNNEVHYLISDPIHGFKNDDWLGLKRNNTIANDKPVNKMYSQSTATTSNSDESDILEIDFKHPQPVSSNTCNTKKERVTKSIEDNKRAIRSDDIVNREYMDSINSYNYSTDDSFGTHLEPVETRDSDDSSCDIDDISIGDLSSYASNDGDADMASILPSISIKDDSSSMQFRLVLQSIIIIKPSFDGSSYTMYTAIRQTNYLPYVATMEDDWLLYDQNFDIQNLEICSLNDIWVSFKNCKKIMFYSLVDTGRENTLVSYSDDEVEEEIVPLNEELNSDDEVDDLASFDSNEMIPHSFTVPDGVSSKELPQQLYDNGDDSENGIQLYQANTNVTNPLNLRKTNTGATITQNTNLKKHLTLSSYTTIERSKTISQNGLLKENLDFNNVKRIPTASSAKRVDKDNSTYLKIIKGNRKGKIKVNKEGYDKNCVIM